MPPFRAALCLLLLAAVARADTTVDFTLSAGKLARKNEPVCLPLNLPPDTPTSAAVEVRDAAGRAVAAGQLAAPSLVTADVKAKNGSKRLDLHFVLPALAAGQSAPFRAVLSAARAAEPVKDGFHWHADSRMGQTELRRGERPVLRYDHAALDESSKDARVQTFKVFHQLFDPATGKYLVTKGPGGEFTHHRGLFYGFAKTSYGDETVDIWHCPAPGADKKGKSKEAHQAHRAIVASDAGPVLGRHRVAIAWNGVGKKTFADEAREVGVYHVNGGALLDFVSRLTPTGADVKLDGDPQHAGFHFRASNEVAERQTKTAAAQKIKEADKRQEALKQLPLGDLTHFIRPDSVGKPGAETNWPANKKHVDLPWLAMSFVVGGKRYTACYLDRPTNPKEARFSERAYGRFGSYFVTTVTKDKPLLVRYRIWLQEGAMKPDEVAALGAMFNDPVAAAVK